MAKDSFEMDPTVIAAAANNLEKISKNAKTAEDGVNKLSAALHRAGQVRAEASEKALIDPKETKEMLGKVKEMEKAIIKLGVPMKQLLDIRKQEQLLYGKEVIQLRDLTKEGKKRVKEAERLEEHMNKVVEINGRVQEINADEVQTSRKTAAAWGKKGWEASKYAASMVGVSLSLGGILQLLIDAYDRSNRIGAMSKQINAQWAKGPTHLKTARAHMTEIRKSFKMSYTEAGKYVMQLSRAGIEQGDMNKLSKDLLAMQHLYGVEVGTSLGSIQGMAREFGKGKDEARDMLGGVLELTKDIPDMSMDEILKDWGELSGKVKIYNTDLLGTVGLYNTLIRDEVADKLGLGDLPKSLRISLSKTIAGFSTEMGMGWQAALGKGTNATERMYEFRGLAEKEGGLAEQFKRVSEFIVEKTEGSEGPTRRLKMENLLENMGFKSEEMKQALSKAFTAEGGFTPEKFSQFAEEVAKATEEAKAAQEKAKEERDKLMRRGAAIASGMVGIMTKLKQILEDWLLNFVEWIRKLVYTIQNWDMFGRNAEKIAKHERFSSAIGAKKSLEESFSESIVDPKLQGEDVQKERVLAKKRMNTLIEKFKQGDKDIQEALYDEKMKSVFIKNFSKLGTREAAHRATITQAAKHMDPTEYMNFIDAIANEHFQSAALLLSRELNEKAHVMRAVRRPGSKNKSATKVPIGEHPWENME